MALSPVFANNDTTTLASPISNSATTLTLFSGGGATFPNPAANQVFALTLISATNPAVFEITWCTARSGDVCTVTRAREGTTALAWNAGDLAQNLLTAGMMAMLQPIVPPTPVANVQIFTASGTYTPTPGMQTVIFEVQGGGASSCGAGGASGGNVSLAAPGTAGAYAKGLFSAATVGASQTVTVGAGGAASSAATGNNGGTSSVGALITAPGGVAPSTLTNQVPPVVSGNGTSSSAPTGANIFGILGSASSPTIALSSTGTAGGAGGRSVFGDGGNGVAVNTNGVTAANPGAGGGGCVVNVGGGTATGGGGFRGIVIAWEYGS